MAREKISDSAVFLFLEVGQRGCLFRDWAGTEVFRKAYRWFKKEDEAFQLSGLKG
jgi:hypothetical protein